MQYNPKVRINECVRGLISECPGGSKNVHPTKRATGLAYASLGDAKFKSSVLKSATVMERQAAEILTPYSFERRLCWQTSTLLGRTEEFVIMSRTTVVHFDSLTLDIRCPCLLFESSGILCRHAIRLLFQNSILRFPDMYLPLRWRRDSERSRKLEYVRRKGFNENKSETEWPDQQLLKAKMLTSAAANDTETREQVLNELSKMLERVLLNAEPANATHAEATQSKPCDEAPALKNPPRANLTNLRHNLQSLPPA